MASQLHDHSVGAGPTKLHEVELAFKDLPSWVEWLNENRWSLDPAYGAAVAADIRKTGLLDPIHGHVGPEKIAINESNLRESVEAFGLNSRLRGVVKLFFESNPASNAVVYAPESVTPLAALLRTRFSNFIASEFLPTAEDRKLFPNTRHEDAQALSFENNSLDYYISCEVMEHIPDVTAALREAARVLKVGGQLVATFPFCTAGYQTVHKAVLENGKPKFLMEPEYHGNPVNPKGSLVFSIPGWDILDTAKANGFSGAEMVAMSSRKFGIIADTPVLVMRAIK